MKEQRQWFRVHPKVAAAIPSAFRRNGPFPVQPKTDILTLLALHSEASSQPLGRCSFSVGGSTNIPEVEFPYQQSRLLDALCYERALTGPDAETHRSSARRLMRSSLQRLSDAELEFGLKVWSSGWLIKQRFEGSLVTLDERAVVLHCYPPPKSRYFILIPTEIFALRKSLDETAIRLLPWLYYRHRGNKQDGRLRHVWHVELAESLLIEIGLINPRRPGETSTRVALAIERLASLGFLEVASDRQSVKLLPRYFYSKELL